jgi:transcriptional regulator GlxA family with amidase domain
VRATGRQRCGPGGALGPGQKLGISLRRLQVAFHAVRGESSWTRITRLRLDRVRNRLLEGRSGETVTSIAFECGFLHLSRFAEVYGRKRRRAARAG